MIGEAILVIGQLQRGGAEGQLVSLARGLRGSPYTPVVACLSAVSEPHASLLASAGIEVKLFPRRGGRDLSRLRALSSWLRSRRPAVVHSWLVGANAYAYGATRLCGARPFVASSRTSMSIESSIARILHGWVFRRADAVIANSRAVGEFTSRYYGVRRSSIHVVPNGVDMELFAGRDEAAGAIRAEAGAAPGSPLVGTVGRLSPEKNIALFVSAAEAIGTVMPGARFVVAGDGPERAALERESAERGLSGRILFLGDRADIPSVLSGMDIFVLPSATEGLPNAVMEAMAAGLPVVATRVGGTPEVVTEGVTGRLVDPGDAGAISRVVVELLGDAEGSRSMGSAGRERIRSEFSVARMVAATLGVYDLARSACGHADLAA
jgi:glycosyltransferase involved in cell wall biosynthesis